MTYCYLSESRMLRRSLAKCISKPARSLWQRGKVQAHIHREATPASGRVPTSPRSRSAESVAVRKALKHRA